MRLSSIAVFFATILAFQGVSKAEMGTVDLVVTNNAGEFQVRLAQYSTIFFTIAPTSPAYSATVAIALDQLKNNRQLQVLYTEAKCVTVNPSLKYCPIESVQGYNN